MLTSRIAFAAFMLTALPVAFAQQPKALSPAPAPVKAAQPAPKPTTAPVPEAPPALTPSEQYTMSDFDQDISVLFQQLIPLQNKRAGFIQALNHSHPGWVWHDAQVKGDTSGFIRNTNVR